MRFGRLIALAMVIVALAPRHAHAQADANRTPELRNIISANPFLLIATWFNAEYEHVISGTSTVGLRISTVRIGLDEAADGNDDADYYSGRAFWRYYPNGAYGGFFSTGM